MHESALLELHLFVLFAATQL
ncbi:protein of unknown function (plasmid) [Caballeronia sp. S22]